jgi:lipopolysaccharide export system protein LptA
VSRKSAKALLAALIGLFGIAVYGLAAIGAENTVAAKEEPIHITAERLEADNNAKTIIFSGSVRAVQADIVMTCDTMTVTYTDSGKEKVKEQGSIRKIVARGNVVITQKNRKITGEQAEYLANKREIIITGKPEATEGPNVIRGSRIVFFIDQKRSIVEGAQSQPVEATIYPKQNPGG